MGWLVTSPEGRGLQGPLQAAPGGSESIHSTCVNSGTRYAQAHGDNPDASPRTRSRCSLHLL